MNYRLLIITLMLFGIFASCSDNDNDLETQTARLTFKLLLPDVENPQITNARAIVTDGSYGTLITATTYATHDNEVCCEIPKGSFVNITLQATLVYDYNGERREAEIVGSRNGIQIDTDEMTVHLPMAFAGNQPEEETHSNHNGFVLAEIFCAGTATPQGSYYYADKYFVIYNNTDHILYADSLVLLESDFLTVMKQEYHPDIMDEYFAVSAMYMIPGSGHDHPVEPGGKLLLVDNAIDHTYANPNSWNMTVADFEWYDNSTNPQYTDIDNPDVANLERIYSSTLTLWSPHTQGFKSYAIASMKTDRETFLNDYYYDYEYHLVGQTGEADMTGTCYKIPNEWIVDAVNMSAHTGFQWIVTASSLDRGYTYNSEFPFDETRAGKSVRRKVVSYDGERAILKDTNNSTDDFEPRVTADPFFVF